MRPVQQANRSCFLLPGLKECVLAVFLLAGVLKADPRLAWLPVDLTVLGAGFTCLIILTKLWKTGGRLRAPRALGMMSLLFVVFLPSLMWTEWHSYAVDKATRFYTLTLLSALAPILLLHTREDLLRFINAVAGLGALMLAEGVWTLTSQNFVLQRLTAFGSNTSALGRMIGLMAIWVTVLTMGKRLNLFVAGPFVTVAGFVLLASGSRGPLVFTALALLSVYVLFQFKWELRSMLFPILLLVVVGFSQVTIDLVPETSLLRVQRFLSGELGTSEQMRSLAWQLSWDMIAEKPLGVGLGGFASKINLWPNEERQFPHNIVLETLLEGGWLAGILMTVLIVLALLRSYRAAARFPTFPEYQGLFAILIFLIANEMVSAELNDSRLMLAVMGIALSLGGAPHESQQSCSPYVRPPSV